MRPIPSRLSAFSSNLQLMAPSQFPFDRGRWHAGHELVTHWYNENCTYVCVMCSAVHVCLSNAVKEGEVSGRHRQKRFRMPRGQFCWCWAELIDMSCEWRFLWCSILVISSDSTRIRRVTDRIDKDSPHTLDLKDNNDGAVMSSSD